MKWIFFLLPSLAMAEDLTLYASVGVGYKFQEPDYIEVNGFNEYVSFGGKDSALFELGFRKDFLSFGLKHDSQYSTGWPVNDKPEYYKTEVFIRYTVDMLTL